MLTQEKIEKMYDESIEIWSEILRKAVPKRYSVKISSTKRTFGVCNHRKREIHLSQYTLSAMPEEKAMNTMLHEVLHMVFKGAGHGGEWLRYATVFNKTKYAKKYGEIMRKGAVTEELKNKQKADLKYVVKCTNEMCGKELGRMKLSPVITRTDQYRCGACGMPLERIK